MIPSPNFSDKALRDFELVQRAIAGNERAYAELMGYYRDSLYFMLLKMVKNKDDAEDLTIEAFGKAFKKLQTYTPNFAFSTWLFKIATNNGIDFLRSKKNNSYNHVSIDEDFADDDSYSNIALVASELDPEENMIKGQKARMLRLIVKKMHPDYRKIITMRYFDQLSYSEIAEELDLPLGTVKARLHRSRELLYTTLKDSNINPDMHH